MTTSAFILAKNRVEQPPRCWLVRFTTRDGLVYHFTDNSARIHWDGKYWVPRSFTFSTIRRENDGALNTLTLSFPDPGNLLRKEIRLRHGLAGAEVSRWICQAENLGSADPMFEGTWTVRTSNTPPGSAALQLGREDVTRVEIPTGRFAADQCEAVYKSPHGEREGCGYVGAMPTCDKTLCGANGCLAHREDMISNGHDAAAVELPANFRAFPGVARG